MDLDGGPAKPAEAEWLTSHRKWTQGWRSLFFPGGLLLYLLYVIGSVTQYSHGTAAICGYAIIAAFAACWLFILTRIADAAPSRFWIAYAVLIALFAAELPFARATAFVMAVLITLITVPRLGRRSAPVVIVLTLGALLLPPAIPSWHDSIGDAFASVTPLAIPIAALASFASSQVVQSYRALAAARAQVAYLAAENERLRIARDLHDLLGHSLTTITVKAGLAWRLGTADPARGLKEMAEVEALARQSLGDVRAAVASYRDVTLAGELVNGRELLRAAGITADLPRAADVVGPGQQELFGWVVREGLTNIVRHAHASTCAVRLSASCIEIVDDGVGGIAAPGNGLRGLRERAAVAGAVVDAGPLEPSGWRLRVSLSPEVMPG